MNFPILVVDDDEVTRKLLREVLMKEGYRVELAGGGEEAVTLIRQAVFPVILSDIRMFELSGMEVLREVKKLRIPSAVILMTGFGSMEGAIAAIQEGAFDYVSKPFKIEELKSVIVRAKKHWESVREGRGVGVSVHLESSAKTLIGKSPKIVEVYKTLARAAMSSSTVLVMGESGTGKELVARAIHDNSPRRNRRFIGVNCGALAEGLLESELFGHFRGSFTGAMIGAITDKKGLFEEANFGTLFLDEIGDIPASLQIKLLRVLQESDIKPVGAAEYRKVDVRLIVATHRDLDSLVRSGKFREDLYYRLKVIAIELPPLRERMEDLPTLVDHFVALYGEKNRKSISHISDQAMTVLRNYSWPGNIRELEHSIERAVTMTSTSILFPEDFPAQVIKNEGTSVLSSDLAHPGKTSLEEMEKAHIFKVLQDVQFNKSKASEVLGIDRATLYRKAQKYGIDMSGK